MLTWEVYRSQREEYTFSAAPDHSSAKRDPFVMFFSASNHPDMFACIVFFNYSRGLQTTETAKQTVLMGDGGCCYVGSQRYAR